MIDLEAFENHIDWAAEEGNLQICWPGYLLKILIAQAKELEAINIKLEALNHILEGGIEVHK